MDYQIRLATIDDLPAIVDIFNQAIPLQVNDESAPIEVADRREWFLQFDSTHPIWVATVNEQVIAWCALEYFYPHPAYDHSAQIAIYIHEDYRRQHLGHDLLTYTYDGRIRELTKAGALICAEIDRLIRLKAGIGD